MILPKIFYPPDIIDIKRHLSFIPEAHHERACARYSEIFTDINHGRIKANKYIASYAREFRVPKRKIGVIGNGKV